MFEIDREVGKPLVPWLLKYSSFNRRTVVLFLLINFQENSTFVCDELVP